MFSVVDTQAALGLEDATKAAFALEVAMQETTVREDTMIATVSLSVLEDVTAPVVITVVPYVLEAIEKVAPGPEAVRKASLVPVAIDVFFPDHETVKDIPPTKETIDKALNIPETVEKVPTFPESTNKVPTIPEAANDIPTVPKNVNEVPTVPEAIDKAPTDPEAISTALTVAKAIARALTFPKAVDEIPTVPK